MIARIVFFSLRNKCMLIFFFVTGVPVRAFSRPGSQLLGLNGRDDGPNVSFSFFLPFF